MKVYYQTLAGFKGQEWNCGVTKYRSKERALKAITKLKKMFGYATLLTLSRNEYGYALEESQTF